MVRTEAPKPDIPPSPKKANPEVVFENYVEQGLDVFNHDTLLNNPINQNLALHFPPAIQPHVAQPISPRFTRGWGVEVPQCSGDAAGKSALDAGRKVLIDIAKSDGGNLTIGSSIAVPKVPFALGFFTCTPSNGFFVFRLVEVAFAAFSAGGAGVYSEVFAEVLVALWFFKFVVGHVVHYCAVYVVGCAVVDA